MPNINEHMKKYEENRTLLDNELNIEMCNCYNWIVTIAFYAAMHLVESSLAVNNIHSKTHIGRNTMIDRMSEFQEIRAQYKFLHDRSVIARYEAANMNKKKAVMALGFLNQIEKKILKPEKE